MRCTRIPLIGDVLNVACPDCGHINTLHVGCAECPVCELHELVEALSRSRWQSIARP